MIRISLVFDHHKRTTKGQEGPVEVRVTIDRKPYYINTGVRVHKERLIGNTVLDAVVRGEDGMQRQTTDADLLNERLTAIVRIVEQEVNKCLEQRQPINVADIRNKVWNFNTPQQRDDAEMIPWIKKMAAEADISSATKKRYTTLCNKLAEYGRMLRWEQVTKENIYEWDVWLRQQLVPLTENQRDARLEANTLSQSAVYNYHKLLKAVINRALKFDVINANPYDKMKGMFKRGTREAVDYLTDDQIAKVLSLTPVPGSQVAMAHDLFIFQMFTGLSYADTQMFDVSQYREIGGQWRFIGERIKTGVPYVSMLLPQAVEVLKRNGWRVPRMTNQRYNQMLKAIGMVIGIEKLHSHMGRHTFATMMLSNGAKIENVSRMLGHTNIVQTQRYAKVLAKDVYDDFAMVAKKLKSKK